MLPSELSSRQCWLIAILEQTLTWFCVFGSRVLCGLPSPPHNVTIHPASDLHPLPVELFHCAAGVYPLQNSIASSPLLPCVELSLCSWCASLANVRYVNHDSWLVFFVPTKKSPFCSHHVVLGFDFEQTPFLKCWTPPVAIILSSLHCMLGSCAIIVAACCSMVLSLLLFLVWRVFLAWIEVFLLSKEQDLHWLFCVVKTGSWRKNSSYLKD